MDHYLKAQSDTKAMVAACKRLPVPHVIWTALEHREEVPVDPARPQGATKLLGLGPSGPGKGLTRAMVPWFSMVGHIEEKKKTTQVGVEKIVTSERIMHFAAHGGEGTVAWEGKTNVVGRGRRVWWSG